MTKFGRGCARRRRKRRRTENRSLRESKIPPVGTGYARSRRHDNPHPLSSECCAFRFVRSIDLHTLVYRLYSRRRARSANKLRREFPPRREMQMNKMVHTLLSCTPRGMRYREVGLGRTIELKCSHKRTVRLRMSALVTARTFAKKRITNTCLFNKKKRIIIIRE